MHLKYLGYGKVKHKSDFLLNAAAEAELLQLGIFFFTYSFAR